MMAQRKGKVNKLHSTLYINLRYLMCSVPPSAKLKELVSEDMFVHNNSNMPGFLEVMYYLLHIWDEAKCKEKFKYCWPVLDQKQKSQFMRAVIAVLQDIKESHPEAQLPNISLASILQPGGDKFCALMLKLSTFVMYRHLTKAGSSVLALPSANSKNKECVKQILQSNSQPALEKSLGLHSATVNHVNLAKKNAETYIQALEILVTEKDKASSELKNAVAAVDIQEKSKERILIASDPNALQGWKRRVQSQRDYAQQLLDRLQGPSSKVHHCQESVEALLSSSDKYTIDGDDLKPSITSNLCSKLSLTEEDVTKSLLSSDQLKLQGLVDIGSSALNMMFADWGKQDMSSTQLVAAKLQAIAEQSEKKADDYQKVEGDLKQVCEKLDKTVAKIYEHASASSFEGHKIVKPFKPHAASSASALLSQIPCTPPWQLRNEIEKGTGSPFLLKKSYMKDNDDLNKEMERLFKLFKGGKPNSIEEDTCNFNLPSNFSIPVNNDKCEPISPSKRSHSPVSNLRFSVNQLLLCEAPPPCKDLRLSAIRAKSHAARFTPSYKQALHHRLTQLPSKTFVSSSDHSSPTHTARSAKDSCPIVPSMVNLKIGNKIKEEVLESKNLVTNGSSSKDSGNNTMSSSNCHFEDLDSSLENEVLLGDLSLQEIAELRLSLSPSYSPLAFTASPRKLSFSSSASPNFLSVRNRSPREISPLVRSAKNVSSFSHSTLPCPKISSEPLMTPCTRPLLSPPAAGATPSCEGEDTKPSLDVLMQRLQAIKSTMKQPIQPSRRHETFAPSQKKRPFIKLELESPP